MVKLVTTCLVLSGVLLLAGIIATLGDDVRPTFSRHEMVGAFGAFGVFVFGMLRQFAARIDRLERALKRAEPGAVDRREN